MSSELADLSRDLSGLFDTLEPVQHAMGAAGKAAALDQVARDLGGDRTMSGLRRRVKISAGYDIDERGVTLNLRPIGLVILAHGGRKRTTQILPRRRAGAKALLTPQGPRANAWSLPSRGHNTISKTIARCADTVPKAALKSVGTVIERRL